MNRIYLALAAAFCIALPSWGADIESTQYTKLVSRISRVQGPVVDGKYVTFTADGSARFTGIAFDFEDYKTIHPFQRIVRRDQYGKPEKDDSGKLREIILFYIAKVPPATREIHYRMVVNGLWSTDPLNADTAYDYDNGMDVSVIPVDYYEVFQTNSVKKGEVTFACEAEPGSVVTLAGTFNNWDPFMYEMTEVSPGKYELSLPLPRGTWYYDYFIGTSQIPDTTNHNHAYTKDGRVASVVTTD